MRAVRVYAGDSRVLRRHRLAGLPAESYESGFATHDGCADAAAHTYRRGREAARWTGCSSPPGGRVLGVTAVAARRSGSAVQEAYRACRATSNLKTHIAAATSAHARLQALREEK